MEQRNPTEPARYPRRLTEAEGLNKCATVLVRRLLVLGLPELSMLHARDAIVATVENFITRRECGEWERR